MSVFGKSRRVSDVSTSRGPSECRHKRARVQKSSYRHSPLLALDFLPSRQFPSARRIDQEQAFRNVRAMSALPPKADIGERNWDVRFVPKADVGAAYSITSSASCWSCPGTSSPSALAVLRLMTNGTLIGIWIGRSPGFSPLRMRSMYSAACGYCSAKSGP
jgi:hypothetical protein